MQPNQNINKAVPIIQPRRSIKDNKIQSSDPKY